MPRLVTVIPSGDVIQVEPEETLIQAAWRANYYWPTVCGGRGECTACATVVEQGGENARPMEYQESVMIQQMRISDQNSGAVRLACQLMVNGPMQVRKAGVRRRHITPRRLR
jgi:ferredoxin, 2Fe-2S